MLPILLRYVNVSQPNEDTHLFYLLLFFVFLVVNMDMQRQRESKCAEVKQSRNVLLLLMCGEQTRSGYSIENNKDEMFSAWIPPKYLCECSL